MQDKIKQIQELAEKTREIKAQEKELYITVNRIFEQFGPNDLCRQITQFGICNLEEIEHNESDKLSHKFLPKIDIPISVYGNCFNPESFLGEHRAIDDRYLQLENKKISIQHGILNTDTIEILLANDGKIITEFLDIIISNLVYENKQEDKIKDLTKISNKIFEVFQEVK